MGYGVSLRFWLLLLSEVVQAAPARPRTIDYTAVDDRQTVVTGGT